jgi:chemotaxis protein MotB
MIRILSIALLGALTLGSCVSKKKFKQFEAQALVEREKAVGAEKLCQQELEKTKKELQAKEQELSLTKNNLENARAKEQELNKQAEYLKDNNTQLLNRLSDLSVVSKTGAENIKKSLEAMEEQRKYIQNLNASIQRKDSINLALVTNLKRSLENVNDEDLSIEVRKGVVYVSLSDKLLFKSGSYEINKSAEVILGKIAKVVNDHKELDILVEGHTDNVPIKNSQMKDNWDLSVMRATAVVRLLQNKHGVAPKRMTAGGRSEFAAKTTNENAGGRAINRRTEIIITPNLEQFFDLMTPPPAPSTEGNK